MNKKLIAIILIVMTIGIIMSGVWVYRNWRGKESAKNIEQIIQAQEEGVLSESGNVAKAQLIASLGEGAEALIITNDFEIGYFPPPSERLRIFIYSKNPEMAEQDAINWIKSRGFSESDICNFPTIISGVGSNRLPVFCEGVF